jgi:hypothetical protein
MKKIILIISLIAIGIGYAGVLNYYGKIVGTVNVQAPIFYADSNNRGGVYYEMKINEVGSGTVNLQDGNRVLFVTDSLGITSWYSAKWIVKIKIHSPSTGKLSAVKIKKVSQDLLTESDICEWKDMQLNEGYNLIQKECTLDQISFNSTDRLGLEITGAGTLNYTIYTDGSTRIEVTKVS